MTELLKPKKQPLFYFQRITGLILLLSLAAVFLFSGYSKIADENAFNAFQWTFLDLGISSSILATVIARLFISFEFLLGIFLIFHIYLRSFTYKAIIVILTLFIGYLIVVIIQQGNSGNCGCFGNSVMMTPLQSIYKNLLMIAATILLLFIYPVKPYRNQEWISVVLGMAAIVAPFILNPLNSAYQPEVTSQQINLEPLYSFNTKPAEELRTGKHIIAFMSLTCPHCRKAAYLLQIIHHQHPDIPVYMVLNGSEVHVADFFKETHAMEVPHLIFTHTDAFIQMAGPSVPAIYWINNSIIQRKSNYEQLDPKNMKEWLINK